MRSSCSWNSLPAHEQLSRIANNPKMITTDTALSIGIPTIAVMMGTLINNSRMSDVNARIADMKTDILTVLRAEMRSMEAIMDARLSRIEETLKIR